MTQVYDGAARRFRVAPLAAMDWQDRENPYHATHVRRVAHIRFSWPWLAAACRHCDGGCVRAGGWLAFVVVVASMAGPMVAGGRAACGGGGRPQRLAGMARDRVGWRAGSGRPSCSTGGVGHWRVAAWSVFFRGHMDDGPRDRRRLRYRGACRCDGWRLPLAQGREIHRPCGSAVRAGGFAWRIPHRGGKPHRSWAQRAVVRSDAACRGVAVAGPHRAVGADCMAARQCRWVLFRPSGCHFVGIPRPAEYEAHLAVVCACGGVGCRGLPHRIPRCRIDGGVGIGVDSSRPAMAVGGGGRCRGGMRVGCRPRGIACQAAENTRCHRVPTGRRDTREADIRACPHHRPQHPLFATRRCRALQGLPGTMARKPGVAMVRPRSCSGRQAAALPQPGALQFSHHVADVGHCRLPRPPVGSGCGRVVGHYRLHAWHPLAGGVLHRRDGGHPFRPHHRARAHRLLRISRPLDSRITGAACGLTDFQSFGHWCGEASARATPPSRS